MKGIALAIMFAGVAINIGLQRVGKEPKKIDAGDILEIAVVFGLFFGALGCIAQGV